MGDRSGGAVFSREEAADVFRRIDRDGDGEITMLELIRVLNPKPKPQTESSLAYFTCYTSKGYLFYGWQW